MGNRMDMIKGSLGDKIIKYAIPLAVTGVLQQLFNAADPVRVHFLCIPVQLCAGRSVRLSERLWRFLHPGGLCGHRYLRGTAHMDIHCVSEVPVFYNDHAGISSQPGNNSGSHPGCNAVGKTVKKVCSPRSNISGLIDSQYLEL